MKILIKTFSLCINTFACLKINQYSTGLESVNFILNPITQKNFKKNLGPSCQMVTMTLLKSRYVLTRSNKHLQYLKLFPWHCYLLSQNTGIHGHTYLPSFWTIFPQIINFLNTSQPILHITWNAAENRGYYCHRPISLSFLPSEMYSTPCFQCFDLPSPFNHVHRYILFPHSFRLIV